MDIRTFLGPMIVDVPWRSQWRVDLERRMEEDAMREYLKPKPKPIVVAPAPKPKIKAASKPKVKRGTHHSQIVERTKFCAECVKPLNANNSSGRCKKCWPHSRHKAKGDRPKCKHEGCGKILYRTNKFELCHEHGILTRRKLIWQTVEKPKRAAARAAAKAAKAMLQ